MSQAAVVGVLDDLAAGPPSPNDTAAWVELAVAELCAAGRIDATVTIAHAHGLGLPYGSFAAVEAAFERLMSEDVVLVVGPAIGDNALRVTPLVERAGVPTINWAGTERARGEFMFQLQVGSHEDESIVIARHLASLEARRVAVAFDDSPIGDRYLHYLALEADVVGLAIAARASLPPLTTDANGVVAELLANNPDAFVYLGLGAAVGSVNEALRAAGWNGPCIMNTAGIRGHVGDFAREVDGWTYLDMYADDNATLADLLQRTDLPSGGPFQAAKGYDLGRLAAEGIARAPEITREGLRQGLEAVKWLPAAQGHDGTLLGFGHHDRGALHGRYLVLRRWDDGTSVQLGSG